MNTPNHEALIRRVLGGNYLELKLSKLSFEENDGAAGTVRVVVQEGEQLVEVDGKGVGVVDALYEGLIRRYAREYQSLATLQLVKFSVDADFTTKQGKAGVDAIGKVTLDVENSEGSLFSFTDGSRSVTTSIARVVLAMVQYFVNAERAFLTLHHARQDAQQRGREDLVSRYTAEMAEVVESTSYADVIANIKKQLPKP
ncbi:MAG TPA: alpha-isopropylmalate synthase regulatory domain-containing protein [Kofleriaceae bacterium]